MLLILAISALVGSGNPTAFAANETIFSSVLDDLQQDSSFDIGSYPRKENDYSLQVIQIAESIDDELFVYVYQPSGNSVNLRATSINISKGYKTLKFKNYKLTFCNSYNTLYKYKVKDFSIEDSRVRFYDITSIFRAWNRNYDKKPDNDNTVSEVPFNVSKIYKLGVENGQFVSEAVDTETIEVVSKYVGFCRYDNGSKLFPRACDSHFVAFSTDRKIDDLQQADIYYRSQTYENYKDVMHTFGEIEEHYSYVTDTQEVSYTPSYAWSKVGTINRDRIQTVADFIASETYENIYSCGVFSVKEVSHITDTGLKYLKECEWVVRFAETDYYYQLTGGYIPSRHIMYTIVSDVSILRLQFVTDGVVYNLGVIDNKQSGSQTPINVVDREITVPWWVWVILAILVLIVLCLFVRPVAMAALWVLKVLWTLYKWLCIGVWYVVASPYYLIAWIVRKVKESKQQ